MAWNSLLEEQEPHDGARATQLSIGGKPGGRRRPREGRGARKGPKFIQPPGTGRSIVAWYFIKYLPVALRARGKRSAPPPAGRIAELKLHKVTTELRYAAEAAGAAHCWLAAALPSDTVNCMKFVSEGAVRHSLDDFRARRRTDREVVQAEQPRQT